MEWFRLYIKILQQNNDDYSKLDMRNPMTASWRFMLIHHTFGQVGWALRVME